MRGRAVRYTADEIAFVRELAELPRLIIHAEFVAMFWRPDVSVENIAALCKREGWVTRYGWSPEQDALMRTHFPHMPTARVAAMVGRSESSTSKHATTLGLTKDPAYLASEASGRMQPGDARGAATRFRKGQAPQNKGVTHRPGWAPGRMRDHQFKPGQKGTRWKPVGSTRLIDGFVYVKVSDIPKVPHTVNWKAVHIQRWEADHGPVPKDHALKCRDGNRLNTDPSNWECIPRAILPQLNGGRAKRLSYDDAPAELKPIVMTRAKLTHAIKRRQRAVHA